MVFYEQVGEHKCGKEMRKELNASEEVGSRRDAGLGHSVFFFSSKLVLV